MASSINGDTLSTLGSSQFDNPSFAERDRLDVELEEFDQSTASSRKRTRQKEATELWSYSREPKGIEKVKDKFSHKVWYCGQTYKTQSAMNLSASIKVITPRTSPKQPSINKSRETKSASPALTRVVA